MKVNANKFGLGIILALGVSIPEMALADLGNYIISKECPATKSLHADDNPGHVTVKPGESYPAVTLNKPNGGYVLLRIAGAQPGQRWIEVSCGSLGGAQVVPSSGPAATGGGSGAASKPGKFLLSASWQPAFCESQAGQGKKECATETGQRFDATHFTLHGLWPQPKGNYYCMVSDRDKHNDEGHDWGNLPEPILSPEAHAGLEKIMPGIQSNLQRHEWVKHGSCFGTGPEAYFRTATSLVGQLNDSPLQRFFQGNLGNEVATADLQAVFEQAFGAGSAGAVAIECTKDNGRVLISGFSVNLQGPLSEASNLKNVLDTSVHPRPKCARGVIDRVGVD